MYRTRSTKDRRSLRMWCPVRCFDVPWCLPKVPTSMLLFIQYRVYFISYQALSRGALPPEGALKEFNILSFTVSYRELSMMQIARSVANKKFTYVLPSRVVLVLGPEPGLVPTPILVLVSSLALVLVLVLALVLLRVLVLVLVFWY